jgi:spore coat protein U-like protein
MQTNRQPSGKPARNLRSAVRAALGMSLLAGALCAAPMAQAATAIGTLNVTATVSSTCIVGASTLAFGSVTSAAIQAGNIDATGTITVNCTTATAYTIALDKGAGTGATAASRKMMSGANLLNYSIYTDAGRLTVWADTAGTVSGTGSGAVQTLVPYGRIIAGQTVPAATYTDVVNVTVTY